MAMFADWIRQLVSSSPGTGSFPLGAALPGYIRLQDQTAIADGELVSYCAEEGNNKELGIGVYNSTAQTLSRAIIKKKLEGGVYSENPGTGVNFTAAAVVSCVSNADALQFRGCLLTKSAPQSIANNTETAISFDGESYDTNGFHSNTTNPSRITIPVGSGIRLVRLICAIEFGVGVNGFRRAFIRHNGSNGEVLGTPKAGVHPIQSAGNPTDIYFCSAAISCAEGDYFELVAYHNEGASLDVGISSVMNRNWLCLEVMQ